MGKRSGLGVPERREAVLSLIRRDEPAAVIARRFGISEQSLYRWRDDFITGGEAEGQAPSDVRPALTGVAALTAKTSGRKAEGQVPAAVRPALTGVAETRRIRELTRDLDETKRAIAEGQAPPKVRPALTGVGELTIANRILKKGARS